MGIVCFLGLLVGKIRVRCFNRRFLIVSAGSICGHLFWGLKIQCRFIVVEGLIPLQATLYKGHKECISLSSRFLNIMTKGKITRYVDDGIFPPK
jgi:hypothetical protein